MNSDSKYYKITFHIDSLSPADKSPAKLQNKQNAFFHFFCCTIYPPRYRNILPMGLHNILCYCCNALDKSFKCICQIFIVSAESWWNGNEENDHILGLSSCLQLQFLLFILIAFFICFNAWTFLWNAIFLFYTSLIERLECIWYQWKPILHSPLETECSYLFNGFMDFSLLFPALNGWIWTVAAKRTIKINQCI